MKRKQKITRDEINAKIIAEGIDKSIIGQMARAVIIVSATFCIVLLLAFIIAWQFPQNLCGGEPCQETISAPSCFPYENLDCSITERDKTIYVCSGEMKSLIAEVNNTQVSNVSINGGNCISQVKVLLQKSFCGYQEADAWFEQYKKQINGGDELLLNCL